MRFCICVSGQMRATEDSFARLKRMAEGLDVQFVFSVWDRFGRKLDGGLNNAQLERMFDLFAFLAIPPELHGKGNKLWEFLPLLRRQLDMASQQSHREDIRTVIAENFPGAVIDIESADLLALSYDGTGIDLNSKKMLYRIWRGNEIKRQIESRSGTFDTVIYIRPDLIVDGVDLRHIHERVQAGKFLVPNWGHPWGKPHEKTKAEDVFAAGSSAAMDFFSSLFSRSIALPQRWHNIHDHLFEHLNMSDLEIEDFQMQHDFAPGPLISLGQMTAALSEMRAASQGWTPLHEITFGVCQALSVARSQGLEAAIAIMQKLFVTILSSGIGMPGNYMIVLCELLRQNRQLKAAALCALMATHWVKEFWEARGKIVEATVFEAMVEAGAECGSAARMVNWLLMDPQPDWVSSVPLNLIGMSGYQDWLQHQYEHVVRVCAPLAAARAQLSGVGKAG